MATRPAPPPAARPRGTRSPLAPLALLLAAAALLPAPAEAGARPRKVPGVRGALLLDGQRTEVRWIDGDTFKVDSGPLRGFSTRLDGYNTLEAYGPVHRVGEADPARLWALALAAAPLLARTEWRCRTMGRRDGYGRALVACPDAAAALVRAGHAMVFAMDGPADAALLAAQREAQAARAGLWAGGVPPELISSLHSAGEKGLGAKGPYDRVVDTRTGVARPRPHRRTYATCEEVCLGEGAHRSCMVYVPFERRYKDRPACLGPKPEE
jgi:endonuclease YncB( thermonuclease family)